MERHYKAIDTQAQISLIVDKAPPHVAKQNEPVVRNLEEKKTLCCNFVPKNLTCLGQHGDVLLMASLKHEIKLRVRQERDRQLEDGLEDGVYTITRGQMIKFVEEAIATVNTKLAVKMHDYLGKLGQNPWQGKQLSP